MRKLVERCYRAGFKLGTMGVEVEVGGSQQVSEFSTIGLSIIAGMQAYNSFTSYIIILFI